MLPLKYGYNKSQDLNQQVITWNNMQMNNFSNRNHELLTTYEIIWDTSINSHTSKLNWTPNNKGNKSENTNSCLIAILNKPTSMKCNQIKNACFIMECGVIHHITL
jgi:hypothetical protein